MAATADTPLRWGRIFAVVFATLVALEVAAQLGVYAWVGETYRSVAPYRWSPYGLDRNNPNFTSTGFKIDKEGFRNAADFTRDKPPHTLRVMVLGGSVIYSGLGGETLEGVQRVDSNSTLAQYLEKELRADPALAGVNIEVINAAVNFNRINEVSTSYIAEYAMWDPDIVIIGGSANNFELAIGKGEVYAHDGPIQRPHPWALEFERQANARNFLSTVEQGLLALEDHSAAFAIFKKPVTRLMDTAFAQIANKGQKWAPSPDAAQPIEYADWSEYDRYIQEYLGYLDAMLAVGQRHHQVMAVFWEHALQNIADEKPLSEEEKILYVRNRRATYVADKAFDLRARDQVGARCEKDGITFLDPLNALKHHAETVFIDYLHYTRAGNAFMAHFIYEQMQPIFAARAALAR